MKGNVLKDYYGRKNINHGRFTLMGCEKCLSRDYPQIEKITGGLVVIHPKRNHQQGVDWAYHCTNPQLWLELYVLELLEEAK